MTSYALTTMAIIVIVVIFAGFFHKQLALYHAHLLNKYATIESKKDEDETDGEIKDRL